MANTCCASNVKLLAVKDTETSNRIYHSSIYCHWEIFSICRHHLLLKVKKSYYLHNAGCSLKNMIYHIYMEYTISFFFPIRLVQDICEMFAHWVWAIRILLVYPRTNRLEQHLWYIQQSLHDPSFQRFQNWPTRQLFNLLKTIFSTLEPGAFTGKFLLAISSTCINW